MTKFTKLLRGIVNDTVTIYWSIAEEIEFVTTFLDLEKLRFGDRINYWIHFGEGVSQHILVPKLVLHTFAENPVKNGIMTRSGGVILEVKADRENDYLKLIIEDNGVGRAASAGQSASTGKGLKISGEFYDILNRINKRPIKHLITDL
jgi:sensor histidine kinase YesM